MNKTIKAYLVLLISVLAGFPILILAKSISFPTWLHSSIPILICFILLNLFISHLLKLKGNLYAFYTFKKLHYLLFGILAGTIIVLFPYLLSLLLGYTDADSIRITKSYNISSIFITLIIVSWEELWFRGIFLNYCRKKLSATTLSLSIGLLFLLFHFLNPKIDLITTGPTLFFAGALLTILYFYYENIWLPIGIHFGNNYFGSMLDTDIDAHIFWGKEGYLNAIILAILFFFYTVKSKKLKLRI